VGRRSSGRLDFDVGQVGEALAHGLTDGQNKRKSFIGKI
jgi:hypothetical protein